MSDRASDSPGRKSTSPRVSPRHANYILVSILLIGLLFRLYAAQDLRWSSDTVPIIDIGQRFFREGIFPLHGSLSSVAAYNMPGLVYLFMPAMLLTDDPALIIILTALAVNLIGILLVYWLCSEFFDREIGLVAAALYTFSTIGIESAYTAWAQMNVGVFFMATIYFQYRWAAYRHGRDMTLAILAAVFAFMIHFAAIVLAIVIPVFYFLTPRPRSPIPVRWLIASAIGTIVLLAPYGYFEITRDFVDVRAFISRKDLVPPEIWLQIDQQGARDFAGVRGPTQAESGPDQRPSFIDQVVKAVGSVFEYAWHWYGTVGTEPLALNIAALIQTLLCLSRIALVWIDVVPWISRLIRRAVGRRTEETFVPNYEEYWRSLLVVIYIVFVVSLILTGNSPLTQSFYFWAMVGVQIIIVACTLVRICRVLPRFVGIGLLISLVGWIGAIQVTDFVQMVEFNRLSGHVYSYRDAKRAVDWIAADWRAKNGTSRLTLRISYDMLPEAPDWWIAAFHAVDPAYHIGMTFNALLRSQHHIANSNTSADGRVEQHDYTVIYRSGLWRYIGVKGTGHEFGQFVVIAP